MSFDPSALTLRTRAGPDSLIQLIYRSTSVSGANSAMQMSDILAQARPRNALLGVTGVLTVVNGEFLQVIEGPEAGINALLVSLMRDGRHSHIRVLEHKPVSGRAFGDWDMVSPRLADLEAAQIALLLAADVSDLETYIPLLQRAISHQDAVLEGLASDDRKGASFRSQPIPRSDAERGT